MAIKFDKILWQFREGDIPLWWVWLQRVQAITQNIQSWSTFSFANIWLSWIVSISAIIPNLWSELMPIWTIDPDWVSSNAANLINGNLTDLCYNNILTWSANRSLPAIDLWSSLAVGKIDLYRWNTTYLSNNFSIQWSNNWTTWVDVVTNQASTTIGLQSIPVTGTYRYWRLFNVSGTNATFVVLSEMKAFSVWVWSKNTSMWNNSDVQLVQDGTDVVVSNNTNQSLDFIINYLT